MNASFSCAIFGGGPGLYAGNSGGNNPFWRRCFPLRTAKKNRAPMIPAMTREIAMIMPAMAPELMLLEVEKEVGVDVLEAPPAVAVEESEDEEEAELVAMILPLLPAVDVAAEPELEAVDEW